MLLATFWVFFSVDMDGDMDVLAGGTNSPLRTDFASNQLVWCENKGGRNPEFIAHVLLGGASVQTFDILVSADGVLVILQKWFGPQVHLTWFHSVPGMSIAHASENLLVDGPVIDGEVRLVVIAPILGSMDPTALEFFTSSLYGANWYRSDIRSPSQPAVSSVITGHVVELGAADIDGEGYRPVRLLPKFRTSEGKCIT
jgi:hypothetical protein